MSCREIKEKLLGNIAEAINRNHMSIDQSCSLRLDLCPVLIEG